MSHTQTQFQRSKLALTLKKQELGRRGEDLALAAVEELGYELVERNFRCNFGEVDLIARDGDTLVFIEVKTRRGKRPAIAKEAVGPRKRRQLSKVALYYMKSEGYLKQRARFDVVAVGLDSGQARVEVVKDAFELSF